MGKVLRGKLAHRVGPSGFADRAEARNVRFPDAKCIRAEHLAGRKIDHALDPIAVICRAQHVHRAFERDLHRHDGILEHGIDTRDRRHVNYVIAARHGSADRRHVPDIPHDELDVRMVIETSLRQCVSPQDIQHSDVVFIRQPPGQSGAYEPRAPGDQDVRPPQHDPQLAQPNLESRESSVPLQAALHVGS